MRAGEADERPVERPLVGAAAGHVGPGEPRVGRGGGEDQDAGHEVAAAAPSQRAPAELPGERKQVVGHRVVQVQKAPGLAPLHATAGGLHSHANSATTGKDRSLRARHPRPARRGTVPEPEEVDPLVGFTAGNREPNTVAGLQPCVVEHGGHRRGRQAARRIVEVPAAPGGYLTGLGTSRNCRHVLQPLAHRRAGSRCACQEEQLAAAPPTRARR